MRSDQIFIVLGHQRSRAGSAFMRGHQLGEILRQAVSAYDIEVIVTTDLHVRDGAIILNKTFLSEYASSLEERIRHFRSLGNRIFMDPVDRQTSVEELDVADGIIASSRGQEAYVKQHLPSKPVVYVPHHADLRIQPITVPAATFCCAYFGDPLNGQFLPELAAAGLVQTITAVSIKGGWLNQLSSYNCHYAVRQQTAGSLGFKPFTKGYTAARCGVPIIVNAADAEARANLGESYPFYLPADSDPHETIAFIRRVKDEFQGEAWQQALNIIQRLGQEVAPSAIGDGFVRDCIDSRLFFG